MKEHFLRLFRHADWANRRVLKLLQSISAPPQKARRLLAHLLAAEQIWITRLRGADSSALEVWPDHTLEQCANRVEKNAADYRRYLETLAENTLNAAINYRNSKGEAFSNSVGDTLTHVSLHGAYHRGQIAQTIRAAGFEPINTDFIIFAREGN